MKLKERMTVTVLAVLTLLSVAVPLVSEVTAGGEHPNASESDAADVTEQTEAPAPPPETSLTEESSENNGETTPDSDLTVAVLVAQTGRVEEMSLEDYVICAVSAEMPYTFNTEALKAQAIAARTYCIYKLRGGSTHEGGGEICTDHSHCAAFADRDELVKRYGETVTKSVLTKITDAVRQTEGQIMTYNGEPILAVFHSRSYKFTESSKNVWGGDLPYLRSVSTPEPDSITTLTLTDAQITELFSSGSAIPVGGAEGVMTSTLSDSGRQDTLIFNGKAVRARLLRSLYGMRSTAFEYERVENGWLFTVHGYGHGVGMSQYGANEMAKNGSSCYDILKHYYSGITLESLS
jgi:stage II sporulation protein D